jgi:hypothetical protein
VRDVHAIDLTALVQERHHDMEEQLAVGLAAHVAAKEIRKPTLQLLTIRVLACERPDMREQPLAQAERLRVVRAPVAYCRFAYMRDGQLRLNSIEHGLKARRLVNSLRTLAVKDLASLVEPRAPTVTLMRHRARERRGFLVHGVTEQVGARDHACEECSHS